MCQTLVAKTLVALTLSDWDVFAVRKMISSVVIL